MSCNCLEIVYGPRPSVDFLCPVRKIEFFPIAKGVPGDPGPQGPDGPEGPPNTNASLLSTGTVPLERLANITNAQLSATAGILGTQIASLDAAKLTTGTLPVARLNGGNSTQFARGDGTYSNTLTGGLTLGSSLTMPASGLITTNTSLASDTGFVGIYGGGAAINTRGGQVLACGLNNVSFPGGVVLSTAAASGSISAIVQGITRGYFTTSGLAVTGAMTASGAVSGTTGTFSSNIRIVTDSGGNFGLVGNASNTGLTILTGGSNASTGASIFLYGSSHTGYPGKLLLSPTGGNVADFLDGSAVVQLRISSTGLALLNQCRINYGSAGTTTAANNEIVGAVGGLRYNVASGLSHTLLVANTTVFTVASAALTMSVPLRLAGGAPATATSTGSAGQIAWDASGNIYICSATNTWRRVATSTF